MMRFIARMRHLSGGKPAGFKLCIGHEWEFLAICKAMLETGIYPDFIVIDGKEGGTGAVHTNAGLILRSARMGASRRMAALTTAVTSRP